MHDDTHKLNKQMAYTLAVCSLIVIGLEITKLLGLYSFSGTLGLLIPIIGFTTSLTPIILFYLKVPDEFLKYYMSVAMSTFVCVLGCYNGIGIYITFILVPVAGGIYFDTKYTAFCTFFSYILMVISVYFNSAGKMEVKYYGWSHMQTFLAYIIGFTFEYIVVAAFYYQVILRARKIMSQLEQMNIKKDAKLKIAQDSLRSKDDVSDEDSKRKNTLYEQVMSSIEEFSEDDFTSIANAHTFLSKLSEDVKYAENLEAGLNDMIAKMGEFFEMDRICIVDTDMSVGTSYISHQWVSDESYMLSDKFAALSPEVVKSAAAIYDTFGYLETNPAHFIYPGNMKPDKQDESMSYNLFLGNQIWIPLVSNGKYYGAVSFDRKKTDIYTPVDKLMMLEAVNLISSRVLALNADNANKAKSDFLSTMSHEIRTPMNAIVGMTEVTLREDMPENVKQNLGMVKSSAFGLLTLINDILDYSKIEAGKFDIVPESFSPLSMINDVKEITSARNNGKLELVFNVPDDLPSKMNADCVRIKQVMINYCTNAIKYTDSGKAEITVDFKKTGDGDGKYRFSVKDTGIGIKKEDMPKLFKSYMRLDTTVNHHKEGTGLGLAICKQLVELMNGEVSVESEYGKGSTFSFEVPVKVEDWTPSGSVENFKYRDAEEKEDEKMIVAPTAKILVVDDTRINLTVAKALLRPSRIVVDTAESGIEALEKIEKEDYDIVFMDHFMPEMDGVETTIKIRNMDDERKRNVTVVALTADAMSGVKEELISRGMNDFLTKPIIVNSLNAILKKWIPSEKIEA